MLDIFYGWAAVRRRTLGNDVERVFSEGRGLKFSPAIKILLQLRRGMVSEALHISNDSSTRI